MDSLSANDKDIQFEAATGKAVLLPQRDIMGRYVIHTFISNSVRHPLQKGLCTVWPGFATESRHRPYSV